jgi:hypothetical protein
MDEEQQQFEVVLKELGELMLDLGDLSQRIVLIGGQALALQAQAQRGTGLIAVETETGEVVERGYTFEPDLLIDLEGAEFTAERLPDILRQRGYQRYRDFRWSKPLGTTTVFLDLFAPPELEPDALPTAMTRLPDARLVLKRAQHIELIVGETRLRIAIPDAVGFLTMKVRAKLEQRPNERKDSFDIFTYVRLVGPQKVSESLQKAGPEGQELRNKLLALFWNESSPGVLDVVAYASTFEPEQKELLVRSVVDLFAEF